MQVPGALEYNQDVDVLEEIKKVTTERVVIENDAKCAAQCEVTYGSLKGTDVGAVCILGTGIGGGMTIGDRVFTGGHGFAMNSVIFLLSGQISVALVVSGGLMAVS